MTLCVACDNGYHFEPERYEVELPAELREQEAKVAAYKRLLSEAEARVAALSTEIERLAKIGPTAGLCDGHRQHLHRVDLVTRWLGGRLGLPVDSPKAKRHIAEVTAYLNDPDHQPGSRRACRVCSPGSSLREEIPA